MDLLKVEAGIEVRSASSTIEEVVARQFVERHARKRNISLPPAAQMFNEGPPQRPGMAKKQPGKGPAVPEPPKVAPLPPPRLVKALKVPGAPPVGAYAEAPAASYAAGRRELTPPVVAAAPAVETHEPDVREASAPAETVTPRAGEREPGPGRRGRAGRRRARPGARGGCRPSPRRRPRPSSKRRRARAEAADAGAPALARATTSTRRRASGAVVAAPARRGSESSGQRAAHAARASGTARRRRRPFVAPQCRQPPVLLVRPVRRPPGPVRCLRARRFLEALDLCRRSRSVRRCRRSHGPVISPRTPTSAALLASSAPAVARSAALRVRPAWCSPASVPAPRSSRGRRSLAAVTVPAARRVVIVLVRVGAAAAVAARASRPRWCRVRQLRRRSPASSRSPRA